MDSGVGPIDVSSLSNKRVKPYLPGHVHLRGDGVKNGCRGRRMLQAAPCEEAYKAFIA